MLEIMRVPGWAVVNIPAREVVGEFAHVERADQNAARGFQARDHCCVRLGRRAIAGDLGAGSRPQYFDVEQVLDRKGWAGKWPETLSACAGRVDRVSLGERARRGQVGKRAERAISSFDAIERRLGDLAGAHIARPNRCGDRLSRSVKERGCHAVKTGAGSCSSSSGTEKSFSACSTAIRRCTSV